MVGLVDLPSPQPPGLGFSISHQKVELDIDILSRSLKGRAEIIINPHFRELKTIRLNCRQCELTRLSVNGKPSSSAPYQDPYSCARLPWSASVHQYHMLRQKVEGQLKSPPEEELVVNLPKSIRIDELDPLSVEAQNILVTKSIGGVQRGSGDSLASDLAQAPRTVVDQNLRFTPITLVVEYVMKNIRDGIHFVGWEDGDLRYPHAYTKNSLAPGAACCLFPCLDDINSRCTWEISIKCAKTIGDTLEKFQKPQTQLRINGSNSASNGVCGDHAPSVMDRSTNFSDEDKALDLAVICTGDMTDEIADPLDPAKKTTSFTCMTAVAPQHVGFVIGPFEYVDLTEFRESDEDDKLGQNAVPLHGYCLSGRADELRNSCLPLAKAIDFFTLAYGSYPFSNYKLCFVDDLLSDILHTGSLSICSNRLLFPEDILEPLDRVSRQLIHALASQWMGINVIPKEAVDTWVVVGIAYFITDMFMKRLSGNNEYRYRQKKASDRICEMDLARPSLYDTGPLISLDPSELDFMALKAPLVLFILDRRLTKASGSSGLSRIVSRVFLNAKVGDLANGAIDTNYFMKTCEKLGHAKLDIFFAQWVFGAGCPRFRINQRFNKKKLVVEMLIQQSQAELPAERDLEKQTFMRDVKEEFHNVYAGPVQPVFAGPMTIRIHEADGTPYEHIIEIKEALTKFEIPYNTKYKRLKRSRRQKERTAAVSGLEYAGDGDNDILLYCLGDVLQSEEEIKDWRLVEWSKEDEEKMSQESYEWIRMDADFEWICKMSIVMPGYMYLSQLQQDRDVVAQLESIQYMAAQKEHPLISTILTRTLMDRRYFHGIRTAAAAALSTHATEKLSWLGQFHLEKVFQEFFCYTGSTMARSNDFSDRAAYYVQCAVPRAIARVRDGANRAPMSVVTFLLEKLKFNDNSNNEFSDCHYLAILMSSLAEALASKPVSIQDAFDMAIDSDEDLRYYNTCLDEIDRYRRLDEWIPSYHNILSSTALACKKRLIHAGITPFQPPDFVQYTRDGTLDDLRLDAFANLLDLGAFNIDPILRWFLFVLGTDPSPYIRHHMLRIFGNTLGAIAIGQTPDPASQQQQQDGLVIEQESSTEARKLDLARKQTIVGALAALKVEISTNTLLKEGLWTAITSPTLTLRELGDLLDLCSLLYDPESSMLVTLKYPRYWRCRKSGKAALTFTQTDRVRTTPIPKRVIPPVIVSPMPKREDSISSASGVMAAPRPFLKPPKRPTEAKVEGMEPPVSKPKLTLKLNLKGARRESGDGG